MWDSLFHLLADAPQAYVILFALAALDAVFPVVPSETGLITAGFLCVQGTQLSLWLVVVSAAVGAFVGDSTSYALGRYAGRPLSNRFLDGPRTRKAMKWASDQLDRRGGMLILVARFVPGGRTATTLTCGITRFPYPRFAAFDAVAVTIWALYGGLLGYLGGRMFRDNPWAALLVAFGIAGGIALASEVWQRYREKRA
jgi:membrane protein DedA with SNARE-associated domain